MIENAIIELLTDAGFTDGWALVDDVLVLWEHEQDPPTPLKRPEVVDEA